MPRNTLRSRRQRLISSSDSDDAPVAAAAATNPQDCPEDDQDALVDAIQGLSEGELAEFTSPKSPEPFSPQDPEVLLSSSAAITTAAPAAMTDADVAARDSVASQADVPETGPNMASDRVVDLADDAHPSVNGDLNPPLDSISQEDLLYVGGYFPFSYLENGSIKIARSLGVRTAGGKPKWSL
jgi:hypothetical protein